MIIISSLLYHFTSQFEYPKEWIERIIKCNGGQEGLYPNKMFTNAAFISTGGISSLFGAYFGIMIDSMYLNGTPQTINKTPLLKGLGRLAITVLTVAPFLLPNFLIENSAGMMTLYLFKQTVPLFFAMLVAFSFVKLLHKKLHLVNTNE